MDILRLAVFIMNMQHISDYGVPDMDKPFFCYHLNSFAVVVNDCIGCNKCGRWKDAN